MPFGKGLSTIMGCSIPDDLLYSRHGLMLMLSEQFEKMGYQISFALYNSANYGVPQKRERVIIIGKYGDIRVPLMRPTHFEDKEPKWIDLQSAIGDLDSSNMHYNEYSAKRKKYYKQLDAGQNWKDLKENIQEKAMGKAYHLSGGKTGFFRRLSWEKPSPTLVTSPSMPATDLCHPDDDRPLSVEEYARIQQFPDNWIFSGNIINQYKQIGNAVPVGLGKFIGQHIINFDNGSLSQPGESEKHVKYSRYNNTTHHFYNELIYKNV
tara:strand:- start:640 stop:1434 length:795 start_codon:yes stop_codon:yes gene_type:complete